MEEAMAFMVHSQSFKGDKVDASIKMLAADHEQSEQRVDQFIETAVAEPEVGVQSLLLKRYATNNYLQEEDMDEEGTDDIDKDVVHNGVYGHVLKEDEESESSESLDEAEKAEIAMMKEKQSQSSLTGLAPSYHTQKSSVLIRDFDDAHKEFTEDELIRQKKEMQQQMASLVMESRNSVTAQVAAQETPMKMFEPNGDMATQPEMYSMVSDAESDLQLETAEDLVGNAEDQIGNAEESEPNSPANE